jgi:hypothetical protein
MFERWLAKKVEGQVEEKAPKSGLAQVIQAVQTQVATGESGAVLVTRDDHGTRVTPVDPQQPAQDDVADQLTRLASLHDRGALTDAEFETQRLQITGS